MPLDNSAVSSVRPWEKSYPNDLRWDAEIPEMTLVDLFDTAVEKYSDRPCLDFMGKKYSFAETGELVDRFAKGLQDQGIGKGSKVGLCLPNTPFYVIAYYAALKVGATVVNFNPLYPEKELEDLVKDSQVDMMVTVNLKDILPKVEGMLGKANLKKIVACDFPGALPLGKAALFRTFKRKMVTKISKSENLLSFGDMLKSKGRVKPVDIHPDDVAVLQYTGGTTGVPKAAMLTHNNIAANTQQMALWFTGGKEQAEQHRMLAVLPFFHVFSMTLMMNVPMLMGGENIMLPQFSADETLKTITKKKPTIFAGVPTIYQKLLSAKTLKKSDLSSLQVCISGGAPLSPETARGFRDQTGIELLEGYGLSESSAAAIANPLNGEKRAGSIGLPLPGTDVKIVPLDALPTLPGANTPINVVGEICLRGPQIMKGYWNRPDETKKTFTEDGWLKTGDLGYVDENGYVYISGRSKDLIIVSGFNVFPRNVEEAILEHPAIADVAVIGMKDKTQGESVKAIVVLKEGKTVTDAELNSFLRERLAPYAVPRVIERRDALPLTLIGKPDKKALKKEQADAEAAAEAAKAATGKPALAASKNGLRF